MTHTETQAMCERLNGSLSDIAICAGMTDEIWDRHVEVIAALLDALTRQQEEIERLTAERDSHQRCAIDAMIGQEAVIELLWTRLKLNGDRRTREQFDAQIAALQAKP